MMILEFVFFDPKDNATVSKEVLREGWQILQDVLPGIGEGASDSLSIAD